ncbi:MAG TPA: ABC transporter substrate-binding protein [Paracoccus sp. (in: a-proteobacteria)]|uniref:ABC transporter substrate-binding protein n=1 Tax=uncultured Paracoccus sp. TaxID=189685 RepID=UPI0026076116|nr:ABC transporter substrate-binding protein [uncultured Paracoccus sp.]HMQ41601.1 ABC transporter substrate-binding protein [Paracoccus sp. (in: a-proteobacteria)]HMR35688.1 ABC transporter substrate-binding protein [Paracoccus sp. (in: a-proteobacteria)]
MKKLLLATAASALLVGTASAEEVKLGLHLGFTGPLESMAPDIAAGGEAAAKEVSDSGKFLDGSTVVTSRSDTTCTDAAASVAAAERQVAEGAKVMVGGQCSGETIAVLEKVGIPNGVMMISPSATSPALSSIEDNGLFFRTAPSDARQGEVIADLMKAKGFESVAITYTNNDYGKGLADSIQAAFEKLGGTVTISAAHDDGKADYSAEVAALAAAGGDALVVAGYVDQGGSGVTRGALDTGAFDMFVFPDGMVNDALVNNFGSEIEGSIGINPAADGDGPARFADVASAGGFDATGAYAAEAYDAAALILLSMQAAGSSDPAMAKEKVMEIANAPGEQILPGELAKGLELLAAGTDIDYVGASSVELVEPGESAGSYRETTIKDGKLEVVGFH